MSAQTCLLYLGALAVLFGRTATRTPGRARARTGPWLNRLSGGLMIGAALLLGSKDFDRDPAHH